MCRPARASATLDGQEGGVHMPARRQPPTIRLRRLAGELKRLRVAADYTREKVEAETSINAATLYRIETARVRPQKRTLLALLDVYGVFDEDRRDDIIELSKAASPSEGRQRYDSDLLDTYQTYIGFESEASRVLNYESMYVPGLLQTERYARAVVEGASWSATAEHVERRVGTRMRRQQVLSKGNPLTFWAIMDEAVLRRVVGGPQVMTEQLGRLLDVGKEPNVTIQVLPFSAGVHPGMSGSFVVMEFAEAVDLPVVYADSAVGDQFVEDEADVQRHRAVFERLTAQALSPADSSKLIEASLA